MKQYKHRPNSARKINHEILCVLLATHFESLVLSSLTLTMAVYTLIMCMEKQIEENVFVFEELSI